MAGSPLAKREGARQRVLLVKTDGTLGPAPVGEQYEARMSLDMPRDAAVARAFRLLKRDRPDENPMCWTVSGG